MQIYHGAVQTEQILKSYSVNESTQYELSTIEHAFTMPTSFSRQKKKETFISWTFSVPQFSCTKLEKRLRL